MKYRQPAKFFAYVPLITGVLATLCSYLALNLVPNTMCHMTAFAFNAMAECTYELPRFVMNLPLVFFIAGGISTIVLLLRLRDHRD